MKLCDFDFELPEKCIALEPLPRGTSKMLYVPCDGDFKDLKVVDLAKLLRPNDLLVFNNTKVIEARLKGTCEGRKGEITLHKKITNSTQSQTWSAFCKPAKKFRINANFEIAADFSAKILQINEGGEIIFEFEYPENIFLQKLSEHGLMPLPPYISKKRAEEKSDEKTYQTIFADDSKKGSVAAPTAGLHFTDEIFTDIKNAGADFCFVTLNVGGGTFLPVKTEDITQHKMHSEFYEISADVEQKIRQTKQNGGRVIAVGTTSLRTLESGFDENYNIIKPSGDTQIFIAPTDETSKHKFKVIDCLFTNFHLPKSTLFILVSAIATLPRAQAAYQHAIKNEYRFFSYGDACFFEI
jgi:S-adenosylmethionine:tRNA ribosyltransferase-isomerase